MILTKRRLQGLARAAGFGLRRSCWFVAACAVSLPLRAAEPPAVLTVLEGEATVVIGARAFAAAQGARLGAGTLIETDAKAGLLRLEWPDGAVLDLGPATRVMLRPSPTSSARPALFYLLQGWAKQSQATPMPGQLTAAFEAQPFQGVLVSQVDGSTAVLFAESAAKQLLARRSNRPIALQPGQAAVMGSDGVAQAQPRPPAGWTQSIPRAFRDTLPPRAPQLKGAPPVLKARPPLGYAALQPWLVAEPLLRRDFVSRFAELLRDREFRNALASHLAQHPEWDAALRPPPKPNPKPNPNPAPNAPASPEPPR